MLLLVFLALAAATVPLTGGRLRALAHVRFRGLWLLWLALGVQLALTFLPGPETDLRVAGHVATYPLGIGFILINRRLPGLWLVAAGALTNLAAIAANGGVMPATPHALAVAGLPADPVVYSNSVALAAPRLLFLGDIFAIPSSLPFSNVFSVGDICIALGGVLAIHRIAGSHLAPRDLGRDAAPRGRSLPASPAPPDGAEGPHDRQGGRRPVAADPRASEQVTPGGGPRSPGPSPGTRRRGSCTRGSPR